MVSHQITLRAVDEQLKRALEREAQKRGLSLNRTVIAMLREAAGLERAGRLLHQEYDDLDDLAGTWSREEAEEFDKALCELRRIDPELWR